MDRLPPSGAAGHISIAPGGAPAVATKPALVGAEFRELINQLREQNFDTIRFATYRAACKLRFIQKSVNLHLVDIWNIIEAVRENGLNQSIAGGEAKQSRIELLLSTVYHALNKRLPTAQHIDTDGSITALMSFLLAAYDRENTGRLRVFAVKAALATLCAGKLADKLRYIFSQLCDTTGHLNVARFQEYLREVLALPSAVFEGPTFGYTEAALKQCLAGLAPGSSIAPADARITVATFVDTLMADPCPPCLMWLPLLHRMANVEHVFHPVVCDACGRDSFTGFRYKCQRCHNYQLCQDCFWRGRTSGAHTNQHEMKEYSSYKSPAKQLGHTISKSLRCMPSVSHSAPSSMTGLSTAQPPYDNMMPARPLDLTNAVPSSPSLARRRGPPYYRSSVEPQDQQPQGVIRPYSAQGGFDSLSVNSKQSFSAKLAAARHSARQRHGGPLLAEDHPQFATLQQLQQQKLGLMRDIAHLQTKHPLTSTQSTGALANQAPLGAMQAQFYGSHIPPSSGVLTELHALRSRKDELESRMLQLQDSRHNLMGQLEDLMRNVRLGGLAASHAPHPAQVADYAVDSGLAAANAMGKQISNAFHDGAPDTAIASLRERGASAGPAGHLGSLLAPSRHHPPPGPPDAALQNDLLHAADTITTTMGDLLREFDGDEVGQHQHMRKDGSEPPNYGYEMYADA